ncbi:hypothetical protein [Sphingomonas sp. PAMC 26621]|uniref:hypothetical protein n=1 Tax=Sphingomonas sp. PAMC 26621 TaxID=1112213 RepID=UPI000289C520|nr:hypothetical protein [Sphingomonas sp. PAMC 26621]
MRFIKLLTSAYVGGVLRHPSEGVIHTETDEATKLFADAVAVDVTDDFTSNQNDAAPVEHISAPGGMEEAPATDNPHQSEVAPQHVADAAEPEAHLTALEAPAAEAEPVAGEAMVAEADLGAAEPALVADPEAEPAAEAAPKSRTRKPAPSKE